MNQCALCAVGLPAISALIVDLAECQCSFGKSVSTRLMPDAAVEQVKLVSESMFEVEL
jgi:hypothetical protein